MLAQHVLASTRRCDKIALVARVLLVSSSFYEGDEGPLIVLASTRGCYNITL